MFDASYIQKLKDRGKTSHIYKKFQDIGLQLAEILHDNKHKALYIKLAKQYDESILLSIAKDTAERKTVANKGAYFMKVLHERHPLPKKPLVNPEPTCSELVESVEGRHPASPEPVEGRYPLPKKEVAPKVKKISKKIIIKEDVSKRPPDTEDSK